MLDINPLLVISFADIFSHLVSCLFVLSVVFLAVQKVLNLIKSHLFIYAFISFTVGDQPTHFILLTGTQLQGLQCCLSPCTLSSLPPQFFLRPQFLLFVGTQTHFACCFVCFAVIVVILLVVCGCSSTSVIKSLSFPSPQISPAR